MTPTCIGLIGGEWFQGSKSMDANHKVSNVDT